jgi:hypothetical protein
MGKWRIVPVEASELMRKAGEQEMMARHTNLDCFNDPYVDSTYAAMLAASPPVPDEVVEAMARAICKARGWNADICLSGSGGIAIGPHGEVKEVQSSCSLRMWQSVVPEARAALSVLTGSDEGEGR